MKKKLLLIVICCLFLCGCSRLTIRGEVMEVNGDSFLLLPDGGDALTVTMDENTVAFSWSEDVTVSDLKSGAMDGIIVTATGM